MNDTRWFQDLTTDEAKEERATLAQRVIAFLGVVCLVVLVGLATNAYAGPMAQTIADDGAKIVLTDEPCQLKAISNLKYRATWTEKNGKLHEGCYAVHPYGVIVAYFSDKTVALMPLDVFTKVTGV